MGGEANEACGFRDPREGKFKEAFQRLDTNGDGKLHFGEFFRLLKRGNPDFLEREAEKLFKAADNDLSGEVDFNEFVDYIFENSRLEELLFPADDEEAENQAKQALLGKSMTVRSAASQGVQARGGNWRKLSWRERLEEVTRLEGAVGLAEPEPVLPRKAEAEAPHAAAEPLLSRPGTPARPAPPAIRAGAGPARPRQPPAAAEEEPPVAAAGVRRASAPACQASAGAKNSIALMSQQALVDYSITFEDLSFVGRDRRAMGLLLDLKDHLRTSPDPSDVIEIKKYLAKGTAGKVFLAEDKESGEKVALKLIRMTQARTGLKEWYISRVLGEQEVPNAVMTYETVRVLPRDEAPRVVAEQLFDAGPVPYYMCLMQEFMNGGTLEQMSLGGQLTTEVMLKAMEDVAICLAAMHACHVQHRDVKPENVMMEKAADGALTAKVCDFGQAELGSSQAGRADDIRRYGVMLFSVATGEGWTKCKLIREPHDSLVARLEERVAGSPVVALQRLPEVLAQILGGSIQMKGVVTLIGELIAAC